MDQNLKNVFDFLDITKDLKSTLRYVYLKTGRQESSAEHSWQLSFIVPIIINYLKLDLDVNKAVNMAIVHDLPESITGDIDAIRVANGEVTREKKEELENVAMIKLRNILPNSIGENIYNLWNEYRNGETEEAKFVKALDKLETTFQLSTASNHWHHPYFISTYPDQAVRNFPQLLPLLKEIKIRLKEEFKKQGLTWKEESNYGL